MDNNLSRGSFIKKRDNNMIEHYAVIGNPIAHSLSPSIHQQFAKQFGKKIVYKKIHSTTEEFVPLIQKLRDTGYRGCNVTVPFKRLAFKLANKHSHSALETGSANTLSFEETIDADSTDGAGFIKDLADNHRYPVKDKRILVLGAGGSSYCIIPPLLAKKPASLTIANRTLQRAEALRQHYATHRLQAITLTELCEQSKTYDLIINATAAGQYGQLPVMLPSHLVIPQQTCCYDLSYRQAAQPFLNWARSVNALHVTDGIGMLIEQAALAFKRWHGIMPNTKINFSKQPESS